MPRRRLAVEPDTHYVIDLTADVPRRHGLPPIKLAGGSTLTIDTNGHLFDGATNPAGATFRYAATGPNGSTTLIDGTVPTLSVGTASALASALNAIDAGGFLSSVNTDYVINVTGDIAFTAGWAG